jgi:cytoskeletal protein CcmA (bactofilin family)
MLDSNDSTSYESTSYGSHPMSVDNSFAEQAIAIIGSKIRFKGELVGEEDLIIQGTVDGTIDLKGNNLTVGKDGTLRANVTAKTVVVEGKVEGDIFGEEKITIKKSSLVKGNIIAARVTLEDGAKFKGSIDMDVDGTDPTPEKASKDLNEWKSTKETGDKKLNEGQDKNKPKLN